MTGCFRVAAVLPVLAVLSGLFFSGATTAPANDLGIHLRNEGIIIDLPTDWGMIFGEKGMPESYPIVGADKDGTGEFRASYTIVRGTMDRAGVDPVAQGTVEQAKAAKQETGYQAVEKPAAVTVGALKGVQFGGTFKAGGAVLHSRTYLLFSGKDVYILTFTCLGSKWANYIGLIERSVKTFLPDKEFGSTHPASRPATKPVVTTKPTTTTKPATTRSTTTTKPATATRPK